jgi:farnesyl-diphosphate farnesyltransferase
MIEASFPSARMPALLRGVSRSFYLSIRLLPAPLRHPVAVAYLLARATDTVADTTRMPLEARRDMLETLTTAIEGRTPAHDAMAALADSFASLQGDADERNLILALPACLDLLEQLAPADRADVRAVLRHISYGQSLDIERFVPGTLRALQTAEQLDEYTYLVAGCVGEFWTDLCFRHLPRFATLPREQMRALGRSHGMALQLVNILRDAGEDLAAGRCYFPGDELRDAGLQPGDIAGRPGAFAAVRAPWIARAQSGLESGLRYAQAVENRRVRAASALPALLGARTLALLRADPSAGLGARVKVPRAEVRGMLARMALGFASRASLARLFARAGREG